MTEKKYEIRDMRERGKFLVDDVFIDVYAKILGTNTFGVYCSLCRHSDRNQRSFPMQSTVAKELRLSRKSINEAIGLLEYFNIIKKIRVGKGCANIYDLQDKKVWRKDWAVIVQESTSVVTPRYIRDVTSRYLRCNLTLPLMSPQVTCNSKGTQLREHNEGFKDTKVSLLQNSNSDLESKTKEDNIILRDTIGYFEKLFPLEFPAIFAIQTKRDSVKKLVDIYGKDHILKMIDQYIKRRLEKFIPQTNTVAGFCAKYTGIEQYINKSENASHLAQSFASDKPLSERDKEIIAIMKKPKNQK